MKESQKTEFKASWRDEYLKHLCAFANTQGGSLFIGVADDGRVAGLKETGKLLEDIPNKAINFLGIIASESGKLKNAAVLLFGKDPLRFFSSVTFKIGRFGDSDHDLRFQDVIEGNIFEMPNKVIPLRQSPLIRAVPLGRTPTPKGRLLGIKPNY